MRHLFIYLLDFIAFLLRYITSLESTLQLKQKYLVKILHIKTTVKIINHIKQQYYKHLIKEILPLLEA